MKLPASLLFDKQNSLVYFKGALYTEMKSMVDSPNEFAARSPYIRIIL